MEPATFLASLKELGLSQTEFARLIEVDVTTVNRWAKGKVPVPKLVHLLLEMMVKHPAP